MKELCPKIITEVKIRILLLTDLVKFRVVDNTHIVPPYHTRSIQPIEGKDITALTLPF